MENTLKFFKFDQSEGAEIVVANFARDAINYYMNEYMDDLQIDDIIESCGLNIYELMGEQLTKKHDIYNEETNQIESISYLEIAKDVTQIPSVIVTPRYWLNIYYMKLTFY